MITEGILLVLLQIIDVGSSTLLPALPSGVADVLTTVFDYMADGLRIVGFFVDLGLCLRLFGWFLAFCAAILVIETAYGVWHKITGNAGSEAHAESSTLHPDGTVTTHSSSRVSRPRLPKI